VRLRKLKKGAEVGFQGRKRKKALRKSVAPFLFCFRGVLDAVDNENVERRA
jgi:hypothetical protein